MSKDLTILGVNKSHNASAALLINNEVVYHLESERISNMKTDPFPFQAMSKITEYTDHIDAIAIAGLTKTNDEFDKYREVDAYSAHVLGLNKTFALRGFDIYDLGQDHHKTHAYSAFYNSGFDEALCIVKDGMGSDFILNDLRFGNRIGKEIGSAFIMSYPDRIQLVERHIADRKLLDENILKYDDKTYVSNCLSEGGAFEVISLLLGFTVHDAGKTMGLASYGKHNDKFDHIYKDKVINRDVFKYNQTTLMPEYCGPVPRGFQESADLAYHLQSAVEDNVIEYIVKTLEATGQKNLCLSGGLFLNCVMNYKLLDRLDDDINIYVEPVSGDAGTAIGAAKFVYHYITKDMKKNPQKNIYLGPTYKYSIDDLDGHKFHHVSEKDVAKLISEKNIVAIYQGRSESGPRALGNRSILYDPRDPEGKDHVNKVKKREPFRPFAGSVLLEKAQEWFDMKSLKESPYMLFAVNVLSDKCEKIPAITHVDKTCRVQTVSEENNKHFYKLIKEFDTITGVPILFNTSFNLAGDCIVETIDDALKTLYNSDIDFLYLPELGIIVSGEKNDS